ncbi:MAG TPA: hypothetical protein VGA52_05925 [Anaerolineales bacterium]
MNVLSQLASALGRNDEAPNVALAHQLAKSADAVGIGQLAQALSQADKATRHDCIKVLYEIGSQRPELIVSYWQDFVTLLGSGDNRMVWGAMTALAAIARLRSDELCRHLPDITSAIDRGSVITRDNGVRVLAALIHSESHCRRQALAFAAELLRRSRPKDVASYAEFLANGWAGPGIKELNAVLHARLDDLTPAQHRRVSKVLRSALH